MTMKHWAVSTIAVLLVIPAVLGGGLETEFLNPPASARPGVYWYFMDGNQDRNEMIADLHAMTNVGIGSVLLLEVDRGLPKGPIRFMSPQWQSNVANAFVEAGNLGMEVMLGTGPGWAGSGGPWVDPADSMQHLVGTNILVTGPGVLDQVLPVPPPLPANQYAGLDAALIAQRNAWYRDVAVLAFATPPEGTATIGAEINLKTLKDIKPYSGRKTRQRFVMPQAIYNEPSSNRVINFSNVLDLTSLMQTNGSLTWTIPPGNWTVMRFVARSTGQTTRPAPATGHGFEQDKFNGDTYRRHWTNYQAKLLDKIIAQGGPLQPGKGLTTIHLDSWEMSSQNWTAAFRQQFQNRRGYDPQPFFPAFMGWVVGSLEKTERFLWDMRKTAQELVLEQYAGTIKQVAHTNRLLYSNEPYDMNPAGDIDLGSLADIPMCEFWYQALDTEFSVIEAASIAHTVGQQVVKAEAFTSRTDEFAKSPASMKNQTDWAFAMGINGIVFHTFQHQPLGEDVKPGMTMGRYGSQWNRNSTLWSYLPAYHGYITRCSHLLRQGEAVADILYCIPEGAPHIFTAPDDALTGVSGDRTRDKKGYSFDAVTPRILEMLATVDGEGRIAFPDGSKYRVLVLPDVPTMTPEFLAKVKQLIRAGATVIGNPPVKSPSLVNYPACDLTVSNEALSIWGGSIPPASVTKRMYGRGTIYWGGNLNPVNPSSTSTNGLFPSYGATAAVLAGWGIPEDFSSPSGKLRFIHRQTTDADIYFVANRTAEKVVTDVLFRIEGLQPQLWDAVTGKIRPLEEYQTVAGVTRVPLSFEPSQSFFVVFSRGTAGQTRPASPATNFPKLNSVTQLTGSWQIAFDPAWGGPSNIVFNQLGDWTQRSETGIRYYSGTATYRKTFDFSPVNPGNPEVYLDLGIVHDICRVRLNGRDLGVVWTAPWRVNITSALQPIGNHLEIDVANGWVNRLIGDQQPADKGVRTLSWPSGLLAGASYAAGRYTYETWHHYKAASSLKPAGLLGPVSIMIRSANPLADKHQPVAR